MDLFTRAQDSSSRRGGPAEADVVGYDRVSVTSTDGAVRHLSKSEFERLPLTERVMFLLELRARFFRGEQEVPARMALT